MRVIRENIPIWKGSSYAIAIGCVTAVFESGIILSGPSPNHNVDFQAGARERREKWSPTNCGQQSAQLQLLVRSFLGLQPFKYPGHMNIFFSTEITCNFLFDFTMSSINKGELSSPLALIRSQEPGFLAGSLPNAEISLNHFFQI